MSRLHCLTQKIPAEGTTLRGSLYAHVEHDGAGRIEAVRFSSPGRFSETAIDRLLDRLGDVITELLKETQHG